MIQEINLLKQEADRLMQIKCETRGEGISGLADDIKNKYGIIDGVTKIEERLKELGYPTVFREIRLTGWYPEGLNILVLLVAKEIFGWTENDLFEMGHRAPKLFLIAKLYIRYFATATKTFQASGKFWKQFETCGELEPFKIDEKEKYAIWRLKDYKFHPIMCPYLGGYFMGIAENIIRGLEFHMEETSCIYKGDPYHEYTLKWK